VQIRNDCVELPALQSHERFFAVAGGRAMESRRPEDDGEQVARGWFVVND
jgi:hypothetical protein